MKALYLFINRRMKAVAIIWVASLIPVAIWPSLGWVVGSLVAALCVLNFVGEYVTDWCDEL